jgi:membrane protein implicated in regulation of membrane protease activity
MPIIGQEIDMDMNHATLWWMAAGALVAVELATGTIYLLMLALGAVAAALAAHLGAGSAVQMVAAAAVGGAAVLIWHRIRDRTAAKLPAAEDPDVNMDIGQPVQVDAWAPDGSTTIKYRGAAWQARFKGTGRPAAGRFVIRAIEGSCLLLDV